jgi:AcrR family transcriptional regulator
MTGMSEGDGGTAGGAGARQPTADGRTIRHSRAELLNAAAACIAERGFERTRVRDVAKKAGVSIGLLQHYFETRDRLLAEAFEWTCRDLIERWQQRGSSSTAAPWERLTALIEELTGDPGLTRHAATWTEFCASSARHPELRPAVSAVYASWRQVIVDAVLQGAAAGQLDPVLPAADVADVLDALVDGFEMATAVNAGLITPERFTSLLLSVAATLLRPAEAPGNIAGADITRRADKDLASRRG